MQNIILNDDWKTKGGYLEATYQGKTSANLRSEQNLEGWRHLDAAVSAS